MMKFLHVVLFILMTVAPMVASTSAGAKMEAVQNKPANVDKIETYLNGLNGAQARFVQTTHDGTQLTGTFYLNRPGKLRFEYDDPIEDFVVADGFFIYFYDAELGEQTNAPIGQTLADFILRPDIRLKDDVTIKDMRRGGGYLQTTIVQTADPDAGTLMLAFKEDPMTLAKWRIVDAQGLVTEIELFHFKNDVKHPSKLFAYRDPKKVRSVNE